MNRSLAILCFALVTTSGCTPNPGPIKALNFYDPGGGVGCTPPKTSDVFLYQGSLDVAGGAEFFVGTIVQNVLAGTAGQAGDLVASNGTILESSGRDAPIIDTIVVSYSSKPKLSGFKEYRIPVHILFDSTGFANLGAFNIIGPDAAAALDALQPSSDPADSVILYATLEFNGFMQRQGNRISSGPNVYPIIVHRTNAPCAVYRRAPGSTCTFPGQEGTTGNYCCACSAFGATDCLAIDGCF
jgi:hypothetical protein